MNPDENLVPGSAVNNQAEAMAALEAEVNGCRLCALAQGRTNAVPGEGDINAVVMFVGEGPGQDEDRQGRPFVGRSGKFLTEMLTQVGIDRRGCLYHQCGEMPSAQQSGPGAGGVGGMRKLPHTTSRDREPAHHRHAGSIQHATLVFHRIHHQNPRQDHQHRTGTCRHGHVPSGGGVAQPGLANSL